MSLTTPDLALVLALHARSGVGARTLTRWLQWAAAHGAPPAGFAGRPREELIATLPAGLGHLVAALSGIGEEEIEGASRVVERVQRAGAQFYAVTDPDYPPLLAAALGASAPPLLAIAGDAEILSRDAGGVVGSRTPSEAGVALARLCAQWLAGRGRVVVSGGAQGIDIAAHAAAIDAGGATAVVLPQGLLSYRASGSLAEALDDGRAVLVSQFLPDAAWSVGAAVARNETIAALSRLVCVIEPVSTGGSAKTGQDAMNQSKPALVYAGVDARGTGRALMQAGARPLLGPEGRLSEEYLEGVWAAERAESPRQGKLL
jgi:DNA processing protein